MNCKEKISFIHANGFPPNAYQTLLTNLEPELYIEKFLLRPIDKDKTYQIDEIKNWIPFHNDYLESLKNEKIIGMGHSIGGNIVLRTAISHPNYFSKIILLDPTLFIPRIIFMWKIIAKLNLQNKFHPWIKATLNRKMNYKNFNEIFKSYRKKTVFSKINDENLEIYIKSITKKSANDSLDIIYSKKWEHKIYKTGLIADNYIWKNINKLHIPTLILKAEHSNAFISSTAKKIKKINSKHITIHEIKGTSHLFPLECPELISEKILNFIKQ
tara:strand:+ start:295 stop:1107 length:813 start_codon:yes stop_codon:yes gene_type:complete